MAQTGYWTRNEDIRNRVLPILALENVQIQRIVEREFGPKRVPRSWQVSVLREQVGEGIWETPERRAAADGEPLFCTKAVPRTPPQKTPNILPATAIRLINAAAVACRYPGIETISGVSCLKRQVLGPIKRYTKEQCQAKIPAGKYLMCRECGNFLSDEDYDAIRAMGARDRERVIAARRPK